MIGLSRALDDLAIWSKMEPWAGQSNHRSIDRLHNFTTAFICGQMDGCTARQEFHVSGRKWKSKRSELNYLALACLMNFPSFPLSGWKAQGVKKAQRYGPCVQVGRSWRYEVKMGGTWKLVHACSLIFVHRNLLQTFLYHCSTTHAHILKSPGRQCQLPEPHRSKLGRDFSMSRFCLRLSALTVELVLSISLVHWEMWDTFRSNSRSI